MKTKTLSILTFIALMSLTGCEKFLDEKPDKKLVVPATITDAQAILNQTYIFTTIYPASGEIAAGDFYLVSEDWQSLFTLQEQRSYIWEDNVFNEYERNDWSQPYSAVYNANIVLDALNNGDITDGTQNQRDDIRGQALFFRSYAFYELLQIFAKAWDASTSNTDPGIALRLSSDFNMPTTRATVAACYEQIIKDTKEAVNLLAESSTVKTRPIKTAGYAFLSRVFLNIGLYEEALLSANNALSQYNDLIDYNDIDQTQDFPFPIFNREVLMHTLLWTPGIFNGPTLKVDPALFTSYADEDLRKSLYFRDNGDDTFSYKGSYNGSNVLFNGLTTSELYLIVAECQARTGDVSQAMQNLNALLAKRWIIGSFSPLSAGTADEALTLILQERRKELVFRGSRWSDLKRLNKDPRFETTLRRTLNGQEYVLPPNDNRYMFPIPLGVIEMTGIEQNPR